MTKVTVPPQGLMDEHNVLSIWHLQLCYRGIVCHGAKWQRWKLANSDGSMEEFWLFCERKAAWACEEMWAFWEH